VDGHAHGRIHGLIEGRALGREKGFEMWEELGFYEGFARTWRAAYIARGGEADACVSGLGSIFFSLNVFDGTCKLRRAMGHIKHLLDLIGTFPRVNPSSAAAGAIGTPEVDIPKLFRQIRGRYKVLCASLGVRPTLRASGEAEGGEQADEAEGGEVKNSRTRVWKIEGERTRTVEEGLSF
jgi:hypothetical protein